MKNSMHASLVGVACALILILPAWADAPAAKSDAPQAKSAAPTPPEKVKTRKVTPHNHMRDSKGQWVPEKKPAAGKKQDSGDLSREAAKPAAKN